MIVNQSFLDSQNFPESVTVESLTYMKELQDSGVTNMFSCTGYIQNALMYSRKEAKELLSVYMKNYEEIYFPENFL
jgi:hypothetical protein